jgi:hypothetical protein
MSQPPFDFNSHIFQSPEFESIVDKAIAFFQNTALHPLPPETRFPGTGVYALYFTGSFEPYQPLTDLNRLEVQHPIYVGKAVPVGSRTARTQTGGTTLYGRLREHADSIRVVENLNVEDFQCRFMILMNAESDLIAPIESELIRRFRPLWNSTVSGLGLHDPGGRRYGQLLSEWDTLHPGRTWTQRWTGERPALQAILEKIRKYFS